MLAYLAFDQLAHLPLLKINIYLDQERARNNGSVEISWHPVWSLAEATRRPIYLLSANGKENSENLQIKSRSS